ncbi:tRNA uridine-5-carboxymethylaminomethyl(34) synthesis GTPase MnmE [Flavobacteriaceae bacterium]|uniref:tRNA uridine-5-carboxymethylaminomethyl(34) synthesis GTPase MnmE n=1 Tax=Candidatus Arcticimaribacter forsetii TaxID=2820661 RepID=UPI0020777A46|nr:tRNA uridine-5-carboxymethylaminomethyl(34) synthesis GTPase MnmE [Candidatus Arcticimaribacter forsetii]MDB2345428.1 tRNA uridine-5-carboxymethylaminomethyl(34) synthesis GTPase MnmE [Flavobacteriaceae bacterium]MDB4675050.1 tRNA uridine-5-carboxymethylaminomethyl(34) synthesis GTPase MnmE [Flavobacteriaceae bacterium]MDB4717083.1 tRNA uridine-5-carboxymethylaminomethyl(34) synthesis GTPase MnmE [Flavobacteriaceae bacterium]MDB4738383.1 tRNA uridine-5-carboxymethylaminomethyl(34) synthesis 
MISEGTIMALSTATGAGAIALIRLSGTNAIDITETVFKARSGKLLKDQKSHSIHLGDIINNKSVIDEVLVSIFKNPHSYTGEDVIEISCHGSPFIQQEIMKLLIEQGAETAKPGEFTLRAFLNGKMDLSQAEAVADLISSENEASHQLAMQQMRGGFSSEIKNLRQELLNFASLIELELDFAEEDVAFADRKQLENLLLKIQVVLKNLLDSFALGNVIKKGVPIAIVGAPNVGKSTLLNCLLNEDKAIISDIAGTTRDSIEDEITLDGICFRFIDTAGIRETEDTIEKIGIQKTFDKIDLAAYVLHLVDPTDFKENQVELVKELEAFKSKYPNKKLILVFNKEDQNLSTDIPDEIVNYPTVSISAKMNSNIDQLINLLTKHFKINPTQDQSIVTNSRHYGSLYAAQKEVTAIQNGLTNGLSGDLLAIDLRQALFHLGEITGEVTNDELLGNIFANFCIGK